MIAKAYRFTTALFDRVFRKSKRVYIDGFAFLTSPVRNYQKASFSVVVGKKVSKSAVIRNRIRRQLYEIVRENLVGKIVDKNVIFIYKGPDKLTVSKKFKIACRKLVNRLKHG